MTSADKESRYGPVVARVNSKSRPDVTYEVRQRNGVLSCNCKGWVFNREQPKRCCHTDAVARTDVASGFATFHAEARKRQNESRVERRAGVGWPKDPVVAIVEELMAVGGYQPTAGTLMRMAGALRPYLRLGELEVRPDPAAIAARANDLLPSAPRCITLDD